MAVVFIETPRLNNENGSSATTGKGSTITLASGEQIPEVKSVDLRIAHDEAIKANITLHAAFRGKAKAHFFVVDPRMTVERGDPLAVLGKEVSEIVFTDGTKWSAA